MITVKAHPAYKKNGEMKGIGWIINFDDNYGISTVEIIDSLGLFEFMNVSDCDKLGWVTNGMIDFSVIPEYTIDVVTGGFGSTIINSIGVRNGLNIRHFWPYDYIMKHGKKKLLLRYKIIQKESA